VRLKNGDIIRREDVSLQFSPPGLREASLCSVPCFFLIFSDFCLISTSNGPIFTKFCRVDRAIAADERSEVDFFDLSRDVAVATNLCWLYRLLCTELGSRGTWQVAACDKKCKCCAERRKSKLTDQVTFSN